MQISKFFSALLWAAFATLSLGAGAASSGASDLFANSQGLWRDVAESDFSVVGTRVIVPQRYRVVTLDTGVLYALMSNAPQEGSAQARSAPLQVAFPLPNGNVGHYQVVESPVMAPELAAKFPEIRTWSGQGLDDPSSTIRLDWTPQGFHAMILSATNGRVFIDPYSRGDTTHYISYYTRDHARTATQTYTELPVRDPGGAQSAEIRRLMGRTAQKTSGTQLRTYRLAVAATGEYTAFQGGTVPLALAAIVTTFNRVNGIYESEVAVRMVLVANNNLLIYTNATTDPYTNNDGGAMLGQNQTTIDAVIGSANYDIGHVVSTGGGGVAYLGVPCIDGSKAGGVTGSSAPVGDGFDVDYVAHEVGHQFGGNHSFNSVTGSCGGGNRNASTAYEPGSGSTIMAYAGICGADDLQPHSDAYFHSVNFDEIVTYTTLGSGNSCAVTTSTGNSLPTPVAGAGGFTIPALTPFTLTGSATDPNPDFLTYNWEEYDLGSGGAPGSATNPPFFRSWPSSTSPSRTFPRLSDLLNNTTAIGEVLPNTSRTMAFRMTVRDNRANGGGVAYAPLSFDVTTAAGPFLVTSPNTAISWTGGSSQSVTWNVANTTAAPVNCANVNISLSTDGGLTFPTTLASGIVNSGSRSITVPNTATTTARVKVACSSSIFFDISNANFTITASATYGLTVSRSGSGRVTSVDGGIDCGVTCSANYVSASVVSLTATPSPGASFTGWSGGGCSGTGACNVTMSGVAAVTASFTTVADFPSGGVMPVGWAQPAGSSTAWSVNTGSTFSGTYGLQAGMIANGQTSRVSYTGTFNAGSISFARRVSSESGHDYLKFYIDGVLQGSWTGEVPWGVVSFAVTAGSHTVMWEYSKDASSTAGSDTAWVDEVYLPLQQSASNSIVPVLLLLLLDE